MAEAPGIKVEKATPEKLAELGVERWAPWSCEASTFDWTYDDTETAYIKDGHVVIHTAAGDVEITAGDLVEFPAGLECTWEVKKAIRKVYKFG